MKRFKCENCGIESPCLIEMDLEPRLCVITKATEAKWVEVEQKKLTIEINGQKMPKDTYDVVTFLDGSVKIKAVYHNAEDYFKEEK